MAGQVFLSCVSVFFMPSNPGDEQRAFGTEQEGELAEDPENAIFSSCWSLLHHLGRKRAQDGGMLLARDPMQCSDQLAQSRSHDDEVPRRTCGFIIRVRHSCWHKYSCPCGGLDRSIAKPERESSLQDVPRLVVGMVDVEVV